MCALSLDFAAKNVVNNSFLFEKNSFFRPIYNING